jgi:hypothetical protein
MTLISGRLLTTIMIIGCALPAASIASEAMQATATISALKEPRARENEKGREIYVVRYKVVVTNTGTQPVRVPTAGFVKGSETGPSYTKTTLDWDLANSLDEQGVLTVMSDADLKPVWLRPKEAAVIRWSETEFDLSHLDKVGVVIRITEAFGKRYDLWFGDIPVAVVATYREKDKESSEKH